MASTRFNYDSGRTIKHLQQSTGPGRYMLNVPGNGDKPEYMEDPHIRLEKWGGNLDNNAASGTAITYGMVTTNSFEISDLKFLNNNITA